MYKELKLICGSGRIYRIPYCEKLKLLVEQILHPPELFTFIKFQLNIHISLIVDLPALVMLQWSQEGHGRTKITIFKYVKLPGTESITLQVERTDIPVQDTTYWCKLFDLPSDREYHVIAADPMITSDVLHHIDVYACTEDGMYHSNMCSNWTNFPAGTLNTYIYWIYLKQFIAGSQEFPL